MSHKDLAAKAAAAMNPKHAETSNIQAGCAELRAVSGSDAREALIRAGAAKRSSNASEAGAFPNEYRT